MTVLRELGRCVFCDGTDMTEEHLIADWAHRAFARKRKPDSFITGTFTGRTVVPGRSEMRLEAVPEGDAAATARVICRDCNNTWLSKIDNVASQVLRPLVRGEREVRLDRAGQRAVAAWIYKSALIFDASQHGHDGPLAALRERFKETGEAGPGCVIYAGPSAPPPSMNVGSPPKTLNLWMLGVREVNGTLRLTLSAQNPDGTVTPGTPKAIPIPGYQIMVGALTAFLGGRVFPVTQESLRGFARVWPARDAMVTVRAASLDTRKQAA